MNYEQFSTLVKSTFPDCRPEAIPIWKTFAEECVELGQFVWFEETTNPAAAVERWLDALFEGFLAVEKEHGPAAATAVINLSCDRCCLYPGEMAPAAVCLQKGGSASQILQMINSGEFDKWGLFLPKTKQSPDKQSNTKKSSAKKKDHNFER